MASLSTSASNSARALASSSGDVIRSRIEAASTFAPATWPLCEIDADRRHRGMPFVILDARHDAGKLSRPAGTTQDTSPLSFEDGLAGARRAARLGGRPDLRLARRISGNPWRIAARLRSISACRRRRCSSGPPRRSPCSRAAARPRRRISRHGRAGHQRRALGDLHELVVGLLGLGHRLRRARTTRSARCRR